MSEARRIACASSWDMISASSKNASRLLQWNGRRRSSRSGEPILSQLFRKAVLLRLTVVQITALFMTLLASSWGVDASYRIGQTCPHDLRARVYFEVADDIQTNIRRARAIESLHPSQRADLERQREAHQAVQPSVDRFPPGTLLVQRGTPITNQQQQILRSESAAFLAGQSRTDLFRRGVALHLVFTLLASVVVLYVVRFQHALAGSLYKVLGVCGLALATMLLGLILSQAGPLALLVPLTTTALILTIAYNPQFALFLSLSLTLSLLITTGGQFGYLLIALGGQTTAILMLEHIRTRTRLIEVGTMAGFAYLAMTVATKLYQQQSWRLTLIDGGLSLLWGTLAGFIVSGLLPLVERCFGIVTDIRLLELGDGSHPLLQELVRRAPGTYTHSITVATLAEPAADAIGANPLMARVGSYFHDIGKMLKPTYFIENQTGENRHDALEPGLSTLVIIGHVKDGIALGEQYRLPRPIIDFIAQHHGTTLVEYFYREALRLQEQSGTAPTLPDGVTHPLEPTFRYPGPKPQTRESGIVMLSDAVESASRALTLPTPGSLRKLVRDMMMKRLLDGQFEESGLTLTELHLVEVSLVKSLTALYHTRIKYPEPERKAG
jgi:cyclic-di-AMP phosphodiesterase PgpH